MKLERISHITGKIELLTGLHIGAGTETTQIGGLDSPIVRLPKDNNPYIPGSSLKGKLRSLLELYLDKVGKDGKDDDSEKYGSVHRYTQECKNDCPICCLFGAAADAGAKTGPARLIVRDCTIKEDEEINQRIKEESIGLPYSEEKTEVSINRITSKVDVGLRKTERVPAGVIFNLDMSLRIFDDDGDTHLKNLLLGLALLEHDALGGSGSRGYGKIKFSELKIDGQDTSLPEVWKNEPAKS